MNKDKTKKFEIFCINAQSSAPSLAEAADALGVEQQYIDSSYGVVLIDPATGTYCVLARSDKIAANYQSDKLYTGPWSSPQVEN